MADNHQTATPPAPAPADAGVVLPRSQDPSSTPQGGDAVEKAARETKEKMAKSQGFWNRLAPEKEEKKPDKPAEAKPDKPPKKEEKPSAATPAEAPAPEKKPKPRKRETDVDPIQIAEATGAAMGREIAKASRPAAAQAPAPDPEPEFPEEFQSDIPVFEEMARLEPKKYSSIKKDLARYTKAETDYIAKWQQEHPNDTYDGDSDEHDAFYESIRPKYDTKDFNAAKESLLTNRVTAEVTKKVSEEFKQREAESERRRERASKIQPELEADMFATLSEMLRDNDPDNADLAKDFETLKALDEKNPLLSDVMTYVHNQTKPVVAAAMRLFRSVETPDANNPAHQRVFDVIAKGEQKISQLPIKDRYDDDGRLFATQDEYSKMTPAEQARHWYIGEREAIMLIRGQAVAQTKDIYGREKQKYDRYSKPRGAAQTPNPADKKKEETPPQTRADNGSPSVSGRGTLPGDGQGSASKPATGRDSFFGRLLGS